MTDQLGDLITMRSWSRAAAVMLVCLSAACGKKEAPPARQPDAVKPNVSLDRMLDLINKKPGLSEEERAGIIGVAKLFDVMEQQEVKDRQELVLPPPPGWKPGEAKRKLKLTLIPEKTMIRKGEKFRYRLEIQNVGQEGILFNETFAPFVKVGILDGPPAYKFYITPPGGKEEEMQANFPTGAKLMGEELFFPKDWTKAQIEAAVEKRRLRERAEGQLFLTLKPGETLITRSDPPPPNRFRELFTRFTFDRPGTYRLKFVYDDRPEKLSARDFDYMVKSGICKSREACMRDYEKKVHEAIGPVDSNTVFLEVVE